MPNLNEFQIIANEKIKKIKHSITAIESTFSIIDNSVGLFREDIREHSNEVAQQLSATGDHFLAYHHSGRVSFNRFRSKHEIEILSNTMNAIRQSGLNLSQLFPPQTVNVGGLNTVISQDGEPTLLAYDEDGSDVFPVAFGDVGFALPIKVSSNQEESNHVVKTTISVHFSRFTGLSFRLSGDVIIEPEIFDDGITLQVEDFLRPNLISKLASATMQLPNFDLPSNTRVSWTHPYFDSRGLALFGKVVNRNTNLSLIPSVPNGYTSSMKLDMHTVRSVIEKQTNRYNNGYGGRKSISYINEKTLEIYFRYYTKKSIQLGCGSMGLAEAELKIWIRVEVTTSFGRMKLQFREHVRKTRAKYLSTIRGTFDGFSRVIAPAVNQSIPISTPTIYVRSTSFAPDSLNITFTQ